MLRPARKNAISKFYRYGDKKMTGFERVTIEQEFTRMMIEALKSNPSLSESIDNASKMGYAISFSFINGMCYTTLEGKKEARRKVMEA